MQLLDKSGRKEKNMISVKRENLLVAPCTPLERAVLRELSPETKQAFFQELLDRTCRVDVQNEGNLVKH